MTDVRALSDGVGPLTFAVLLGVIIIFIMSMNAVLTAFGQIANQMNNALGVSIQFPPQGSNQLFTGISLAFYILAAGLFLLLVFTAWRSIREE
jgi:glucan phosphoethanolaminetransferase (alkaline phosphatase superfamily)